MSHIQSLCLFIIDAILYSCKYGVLSVCYPAGELECYTGPVEFSMDGWEEEQRLSLREAARKQAPWNAFVSNACKCTTGCGTRRCRCVKQGISCSSHCHGARSCSNKNASPHNTKAKDKPISRKNKTQPQPKSHCVPQGITQLCINVIELIKNNFTESTACSQKKRLPLKRPLALAGSGVH